MAHNDEVETFRLVAGNHFVELCNVGASVTALHVHGTDIVLGYASSQALYQSGNPCYIGTVVGRVANRIANGRFDLQQGDTVRTFQLELNNGSHHLHGGVFGFHRQVWSTKILSDTSILFTYLSPDGDQGYPGSILTTALYSLSHRPDDTLTLMLTLEAQLVPCEDGFLKATPVNLAQHCKNCPAGWGSRRSIFNEEKSIFVEGCIFNLF